MGKKSSVEKIKCIGECGKELSLTNFYNSKSPMFPNGKAPLCKKCIKEKIDYNNMQSIYDILQSLDLPFIYDIWDKTVKKNPKDIFGNYLRQLNSLPQYSGMSFKDSVYESKTIKNNRTKRMEHVCLLTSEQKDQLIDKWGFGYNDEELYSFEKKYSLLKNNYPERTAMHTESLLTYIRYRVKEELATAKGDVTEASKWGGLADKASERAKINPSQLSKADLSGGLNGFGELSRAVEQAVDIVPILPKFKEKPQDKVDFTLWCYINYIRRLKNMPDVEYKEIYKFYEDRKEEYKRTPNREFEFEDEENE